MAFQFHSLPEKVVKVSLPYLLAAVIAITSMAYAAGSYKTAFLAQQDKNRSLEEHMATLESAIVDLSTKVAVLSQRIEDLRDDGK